jgi:tRNA threonylcarbamoyl adenosine modification protein YeaZ
LNLKYSAAIDLSGKYAGFALAETASGKVLVSEHKKMHGRSSSSLCTWMLELLSAPKIDIAEIGEWTVASGPGSFTGMRLAAALATGISLGQSNIKTRCVPGAVALAGSVEYLEGEKLISIFDGRNREILLFELIKKNGEMIPTGVTKVLNREQAKEFFAANQYKHIVAPAPDRVNIELVLPEDICGKIQYFENLPLEKLIACKYKEFDNDLTDLVYIRPAVFS